MMQKTAIASLIFSCWTCAFILAQKVQPRSPVQNPETVDVQTQTTGTGLSKKEPVQKATEVLGEEVDIKQGDFVKEILEEREELPLFGYELFKIDTSQLTPGPIDPETYLISPGDKLLLRLWGELNWEALLEVSSDLYVTIPAMDVERDVASKIGRVYLSGQTLREAHETIRRELASDYESFIDPDNPLATTRVELTPTHIREVRFFVQGEVKEQGSYTLHPSHANLIYALASAGGIQANGSLRQIQVRRGGHSFQVDFYDFLMRGQMGQQQLAVQHNDIIFVPLKRKEASIRGEVRRPAKYELRDKENFRDLVEMAGGLKPSASLEKALILRTELNEGLKTIDVNLKQLEANHQEMALKDQDIVNIFSTYLMRIDYVSVQGEGIALAGEYQLREEMHLKDLITEAGGLTGQAYLERADLMRTRANMTRFYQSLDLRKVLSNDPKHNLKLQNLDQLIVYTVQEIEGENHFVTVSGHVKNPGRFQLYQGMRIFDLLFAKGGFQDKEFLKKTYTPRGNILRVSKDGSTRRLITFNLENLLKHDPAQNFLLQADDQIHIYSVEEVVASKHEVTLSGHVKQEGKHPLYEEMTLSDLLDVTGGFQDREFRKQTFLERGDLVRWERKDDELQRKIIRFNLGALLLGDDSQDQLLQVNDEIIIYAVRYFMIDKVVSIDGFVKRPGANTAMQKT